MAVVNMAFELAPDIVEGLASGAYKLFGGVVRDQAGRIVCHLPEAINVAKAAEATAKTVTSAASTTTKTIAKSSIARKAVTTTAKKAPSLLSTIGSLAKAHPVITAVIALAAAAGTGYGIYCGYQNKKTEKAQMERAEACVEQFSTALDTYYKAIQQGTLNETIINDLISAIDTMREAISDGIVRMEFSAQQINNMLGIISYFTKEFAGANHYKYTEPERPQKSDTYSNLLYFSDYLKIQRDIYRVA